MENKLIGFEVAKLAKESGFSFGSSNVWIEYSDKSFEQSANYYTINNNKDADLSCKGFTLFESPTQSLLQKWFRDVHNIHLEINVNILKKWYFTGYDLSAKRCDEIEKLYKLGENIKENSYEEALEIALFESLKFIKIK